MSGQIDISGLTAVGSAQLTDIFPVVQSAITQKESIQQVLDLFSTNITIAESQVTNLTTDLAARMLKSANLSDVSSISTSRTNLGLGTGDSVTFTNLSLSTLTSHTLLSSNSGTTIVSASLSANFAAFTGTLDTVQNIQTSSSPTFVGLNLSGLTASYAVVTDGSNNLSSLIYGTASSASSLIQRDSNQNAFANNFISKATNISAASGTTTLTSASTRWQNLTGSQPQTFQLPDATTLSIGSIWYFNNNTTNSTLTVKDGGGSTLFTIPFGGQGYALLLVNVITAGSWDYHFGVPSNASWGTSGLTVTGTLSVNTALSCSTFKMTNGANNGYFMQGDGSGNGSWAALSGVAVTTLTGTANQVLVNGTTATPTSGAITLTLPQDIGTGSSPTFSGLTLSSLTGNTIVYANSSKILASATISANFAPFSGALNTIQDIQTNSTVQFGKLGLGVAASNNQLSINGKASIGYSDTSAPTSGLIVSGQTAINTSSATSGYSFTVASQTTGGSISFPATVSTSTGYKNINDTNAVTFTDNLSGAVQSEIYLNSIIDVSSTKTVTSFANIYVKQRIGSGTGTISTLYGLFVDAGTGGSTSVSTSYGGYFKGIVGSTAIALYTDDFSVGFAGTYAGSNCAIIAGSLGVNTSTLTGTSLNIIMDSSIGNYYGLQISGSFLSSTTGGSAGANKSLYIHPTFTQTTSLGGPSAGSVNAGIHCTPVFAPGGGTLSTAVSVFASNTLTGNAGTISNLYGFYYDGGGSLVGTVTNNFGIYVTLPAAGTNKYTAYFDTGVGIGVTTANIFALRIGTNALTTYSGIKCNATFAVTDSGTATGSQRGIDYNPTFTPTSNPTTGSAAYGIAMAPSFAHSGGILTSAYAGYFSALCASNGGTITTAYGLFIDTGSAGGVITTGFGLYVNAPLYGTNKYTAYFGGQSAFAANPSINYTLNVGTATSAPYLINASSTILVTDGGTNGTQRGFNVTPTFAPSSNPTVGSLCASIIASGTFAPAGGTLTQAVGLYASGSFVGNAGTITSFKGIFFDGAGGNVGTINNAYGLFIQVPTAATTNYCAYFACTAGGFFIDANGNFINNSGTLGTTATNGWTYTSKCAGTPTGVPSNTTGVPLFYDSTNNKLYVYNGAWKGVTLT